MRSLYIISVCLFMGLVSPRAAAESGSAPAAPAPSLDQVIDGIQGFYGSVTDFKAEFHQVVRRKHLPRPLRRQGMVYFKKPGMMRWDYTQPDKVLYVSDGNILWAYEPAEKVAHKLRVQGSELYSSLKFLFGQGKLREEFDLAIEPARDGLISLRLVPKEPQSGYKSLVLRVDPTTWEIRVTEMVDPLDTVSEITFKGPVYAPLKDAGFRFQPPAGTRVEDLSAEAASPEAPPEVPAPEAPPEVP
ncbi:MAG: outer membrane lipoprotein carrier protein LolA [Myxococcota bacterium]|nr:outer membrane lipoprotein carrier protein LolA [Myxococcota bacterium]